MHTYARRNVRQCGVWDMASMEMRRVASAAGLLAAAATLATGVWLAFLGWKQASIEFGLSGVALAIAAPAIAVAAAFMRIAAEPDLFDAVNAAESALRYIRLARAHICMLAAGAAVYGFSVIIGFMGARAFVAGYAVLAAASLAVYLPWLARREKRGGELLENLRAQLRSARSGDLLAMH